MSIIKKTLSERDLLSQISHEKTEIKKIYAGFDGTAKSLQIGNLTPIAALKHLAKAGIEPIVVLGGATSRVGDPSGKNTTRKQLYTEDIDLNISIIQQQIKKLLPEAKIVNNADWLSSLSFMEFLDNIANHISVSYILNFKTFSDRLKNSQPLSIKEILYPLMQGYDFLHLFETEQCDAQLGGHDQWCNVLTGVDLIQHKHSKDTSVIAVTSPLLVDRKGHKMGKSVNGAIYLSSEMCAVYDFWNFWRNVDDCLVKTCFLRFTDLPIKNIDSLLSEKDINQAKILLADTITRWVHSEEECEQAKKRATTIFVDKNFDDLPITISQSNKLSEIIASLNAISNSEAKRLILSGAVKINGKVEKNTALKVHLEPALINIGKKNVFKVAFVNTKS